MSHGQLRQLKVWPPSFLTSVFYSPSYDYPICSSSFFFLYSQFSKGFHYWQWRYTHASTKCDASFYTVTLPELLPYIMSISQGDSSREMSPKSWINHGIKENMCLGMFKQALGALGLLQKVATTVRAWPFPKYFYFFHFVSTYKTGLA